MRVLLVGPDYEANLSLQYLASSLRAAGHEPLIAPFNTAADAPSVVALAREADLVGLSMCFQVRAMEFLDLAAALKHEDPARPVIAGGHYASCAADELIARHPALDAIAVHEGEQTLVELANLGEALVERAASVSGVVVLRDGHPHHTAPRPIFEDLDALPRPDRSGPARLLCGVPTAYLMGSRGCVSACDYCCITTLHRMARGPRFRQRTPEDVAAEMGDLYHHHGVRQFVFHDDNFLVPSYEHNRKRIARLGAALEARGVRDVGLVTKCSPRDAHPRILETLRGMGLLRLFMGIESGSACGLESIGRAQTVEQSERALETCERLGISSQYTMIIFSPEATPASMLADLDFIGRHPGHPLNYCRAEIYAGTPLEARMIAQGRAEGDYLGRVYRYADPTVALIWERGRDLFAGRCWGEDELLGKVIRMDHQVAVLGHFYEGRAVRELVQSFLAWEVDLNLETAGFFRELVLACAGARDRFDPALDAAIDDLRRREGPARQARLEQACELRKALERYSKASVESGKQYARRMKPSRRRNAPRHAAAVAVAIGLLGGPGASASAPPPPPIDSRGRRLLAQAEPPRPAPREDMGVAEAAPPPIDERPPMLPLEPLPPPPKAKPDAGAAPRRQRAKADAGTPPAPDIGPLTPKKDSYRHDHGVAEAAPPPYDRYRHDHGVAEAAPPPYDRGINKYLLDEGVAEPEAPAFTISTAPAWPITFRGTKVRQPFRWVMRGPVPIGIQGPGSLAVTLIPLSTGPTGATLVVRATAPLSVRFGAVTATTPARISVEKGKVPPPLVIEDPETKVRLVVRLRP